MQTFKWLLFICIISFSCKKEKEYKYPFISTNQVSNINKKGAEFSANLMGLDDYEYSEYGFVWSNTPNPTLNNSEKYSLYSSITDNSFSQHISTTLKDNEIYYVRSYIKSNEYLSYGNEVAFKSQGSQGPDIIDFYPKSGNLGDTISIIGENFSHILKNNIVKIGGLISQIVGFDLNQKTLKIIIPQTLYIENAIISVSIQGNETNSTESFNLITPVIANINQKISSFGSIISIDGNNFLANKNSLKAYFGEIEAEIIEIKNTQIAIVVPNELNTRQSTIKIVMNNIETISNDTFRLAPISLVSFHPQEVLTGGVLTLRGNNFSPIPENNKVYVGGIPVSVNKASLSEIEFILPLQDKVIYPSRNLQIKVEVAGQEQTFVNKLLINDQWFRLKDAPSSLLSQGYAYNYVNCFVAGDKAYVGLNKNNTFLEYDPLKDEWKTLKDFPGGKRFDGTGFTIADNIFFGTGATGHPYYIYYNDWWKYNINDDSWTLLNNFSGKKRTGAFGFEINNKGYVGSGSGSGTIEYFTDVWKYDEIGDFWSKIADFPKKMRSGIALSTKTSVYAGLGDEFAGDISFMYKYSPIINSWESITDFPQGGEDNDPLGFVLNNQVYIGLGYWHPFHKFNSTYQSWSQINIPVIADFRHSIAFSVGDKAYVGLGMYNWMWEYDPSR